MAAEASRTMFRISKKLQECFKQVSFFSCNFLAKSTRYRQKYLNQFKKMSGKGQSDRKKREKVKHKQQTQKIRQQIKRLKERYRGRQFRDEQNYKGQEKYHHRQREGNHHGIKHSHRRHHRERQHRKQTQIKDKFKHRSFSFQKQKDQTHSNEKRQKQKKDIKEKQKKIVSDLQKQREFDFDNDQAIQALKKNNIYEEDQSNNLQKKCVSIQTIKNCRNIDILMQKKQVQKILWSKRNVEKIGSQNPQKYKILKIDEQTSDFQDQNAPLRVPQIKPREPLTPYFLFLRKNRYRIQKQYPNVVQVGSLTNIWIKLSDELKKPYIQQYTRASQIYSKLITQYYAIHPEKQQQQKKQKSISKGKDFQKNENQKIEQVKRKRQKRDDQDQYQSKSHKKDQKLVDLDQFQL